mmetsp:Transcript_33325/g.131345  ORF Transcript_33325/g.131345 Transcript_33325/m.131345 type:complete len:82 (+) Transcript_33325:3129-3374(+)
MMFEKAMKDYNNHGDSFKEKGLYSTGMRQYAPVVLQLPTQSAEVHSIFFSEPVCSLFSKLEGPWVCPTIGVQMLPEKARTD